MTKDKYRHMGLRPWNHPERRLVRGRPRRKAVASRGADRRPVLRMSALIQAVRTAARTAPTFTTDCWPRDQPSALLIVSDLSTL